jgi:hypothetical protein
LYAETKEIHMQSLTILLTAGFILTTILAIYIFYWAANSSKRVLLVLLGWVIIQCLITMTGFYENSQAIPPRLIFLLLPPVIFISVLFISPAGRKFIDTLQPAMLTILHIVRIPVEMILYGLFLNREVPQLMTFAGGNYDIISGITAPFIYYFGFIRKKIAPRFLLVWNLVCLGLLLFIVRRAILSIPSPFQSLAFEQPNIAIQHFPYTWLPAVLVPLVLFSHLVIIRKFILSFRKIKTVVSIH